MEGLGLRGGGYPTAGTAMEPSSQHPQSRGASPNPPPKKKRGGCLLPVPAEPQADFWGAAAFSGCVPRSWGGAFTSICFFGWQTPPSSPPHPTPVFIFPVYFQNPCLPTHVPLFFPVVAATPPEMRLGFDRCWSCLPAAAPARSERSCRCDDAHQQLKSIFLFSNKLTAPAAGQGNG